MTLAAHAADRINVAAGAAAQPRALRPPQSIIFASINREEGGTGVHTHTRMLSAGLREAGINCDIVSPFSGSKKWLPIFALRPLVLKKINKTWSTLWHRRWHAAALREILASHLSRGGVDAILAQCPVSAQAALDVRASMRLAVPVVMVCHFNGSEAAEYRDKGELNDQRGYDAMLRFESRVLGEVDRVIYVSNWARENVETARSLKTRSSAVIWNGVSTSTAPPLSRESLGLSSADLVLANVGSIEPRKNQLGLIDLFATIRQTFTNAKLVLIGDGPQRGDVERKVEQLGLASLVKLLGHRRDVPAVLPLTDLYVHYANLENCPLVLLEAARAAVPIAAIPTGGVPELQTALDCRIELDPADVRSTLERLRPLLASEDLRRDYGRRARSAFEKAFTQKSMTDAYINALSFAKDTDAKDNEQVT